MSLLGAMNTAISGMTAQSQAFGNISDNVANSQTVGYKRIDTNFVDYLTTSSASENTPGVVIGRPDYVNNVQGTIQQSQNPLAMAVTGDGFFAVSQPMGTNAGQPIFNPQQQYTRTGDFRMDAQGYLVNSAGSYLNGWSVDATTGLVNRASLSPIQIDQSIYNPVATSTVDLAANLPATPAAGTAMSTQLQIYDTLGSLHTVTLDWTQNAGSDWTVAISSPDDIALATRGTADLQFGPLTSGNPVPDGTIGQVTGTTGSASTGGYVAGAPATLTFTTDFGNGPQTITLSLGQYGAPDGLTQFAGTQLDLRSLTQNGVPPGSFSGISVRTNGDIVASYDNGQIRTIAQVPLVTFNAPNSLQRQNGQNFTTTVDSGTPTVKNVGANGAGSLVTNAVENSNVDIATEFSKLIVAQRAYSANTKIVTTADDLLQQTIDIKR
jgi:flagellar hook protein FlgE